jgi:hypothetical protein
MSTLLAHDLNRCHRGLGLSGLEEGMYWTLMGFCLLFIGFCIDNWFQNRQKK